MNSSNCAQGSISATIPRVNTQQKREKSSQNLKTTRLIGKSSISKSKSGRIFPVKPRLRFVPKPIDFGKPAVPTVNKERRPLACTLNKGIATPKTVQKGKRNKSKQQKKTVVKQITEIDYDISYLFENHIPEAPALPRVSNRTLPILKKRKEMDKPEKKTVVKDDKTKRRRGKRGGKNNKKDGKSIPVINESTFFHPIENSTSSTLSSLVHLSKETSCVSNAVIAGKKTQNTHELAAEYRRITTMRTLQMIIDSTTEGSTIILFDCFGSKRTFYWLVDLLTKSKASITIIYQLIYQYNVAKDASRYDNFDPNSKLLDPKYSSWTIVGNSVVKMENPYELRECSKLHPYDPIFYERDVHKAIYLFNDIYDINDHPQQVNGLTVPQPSVITSTYLWEMTCSNVCSYLQEVYWIGRLFKDNSCYSCGESFAQVHNRRVFFYPSYKDHSIYYDHSLQDIEWCHRLIKGETDIVIFTNYSEERYLVGVSDYVCEFRDLPDLKKHIRAMLTQPNITMSYNSACSIRGTVNSKWFLGNDSAPMKNSKHTDIFSQSVLEVIFLELADSVNDLVEECKVLRSDPRSFQDKNIASSLKSPVMPVLKFLREHLGAVEGLALGGAGLVTALTLVGTKVITIGGSLLGSLLMLVNPVVGACFQALIDPLLEESVKHFLGPIGYIIHSLLEIVVGAIVNPATIPLRLAMSLAMSWFDHLTNVNPNVKRVFKPLQVLIHMLFNICGLIPFGFIPCTIIVLFTLSFCTACFFDYINVVTISNRIILAIKKVINYLRRPGVDAQMEAASVLLAELLTNLTVGNLQTLSVVDIIKITKVTPDPSLFGDKYHPLYDEMKDPVYLARNAEKYKLGSVSEKDVMTLEMLQQEAYTNYCAGMPDLGKQHGILLYNTWLRFGEMYTDPLYSALMVAYRVLAPTNLNILHGTDKEIDYDQLNDFRKTVKNFANLLPTCEDYVLDTSMTLQDLSDYFKSKFTAQKFGLYKAAFEGCDMECSVESYLTKALKADDDHVTEVIQKANEVLAKEYREIQLLPNEEVNYCARAIANVKKEGVIGMTWLTENAKHFLLERQKKGEYIQHTRGNIQTIYMLGCGVPHKDLAEFLNNVNLTADLTLLAIASGDDITMFEFAGKALTNAMSLDLTKYDTAQDEVIIDAETEFFARIMPHCEHYIKAIFREYFTALKKITVRKESGQVIQVNLKRVIRLSGHADTSFGNTLINLALTFYIFSRSTSLIQAYERAMSMKDVGFKYTGAKPTDCLYKQTFLRSIFVRDEHEKIRLIPSLGVLIKPLLRIKDVSSWGTDYNQLDTASTELIIRRYYKSYFRAFANITTNPIFREIAELWETDPIEVSEDMLIQIRAMFEYTIIGWETDEFTYDFDRVLRRYTDIDKDALRLFMLNAFSPVATFGRVFDYEENVMLINIMVADYGVERSLT